MDSTRIWQDDDWNKESSLHKNGSNAPHNYRLQVNIFDVSLSWCWWSKADMRRRRLLIQLWLYHSFLRNHADSHIRRREHSNVGPVLSVPCQTIQESPKWKVVKLSFHISEWDLVGKCHLESSKFCARLPQLRHPWQGFASSSLPLDYNNYEWLWCVWCHYKGQRQRNLLRSKEYHDQSPLQVPTAAFV